MALGREGSGHVSCVGEGSKTEEERDFGIGVNN